MKRIALAVLFCLLFASISFAQQTKSDALASKVDIEKYLDAVHARDMMKSTLDAMTNQMHQIVHKEVQKQPNLPADSEARLNKMMDDMVKDLPIDELLQAMVPVYQKHFTKEDVDALTTFYSTPSGQRILKEMPVVTAESMQATMGIIQKMMAKVQERMQSEIAELQKEHDGNSKPQPQSAPN
jgi:hypothetical protein